MMHPITTHEAHVAHDLLTERYEEVYAMWRREQAVLDVMRAHGSPVDDRAATELHARMDELTSAIGRCEAGTYGICQLCAEPIAADRLDEFPAAVHCGDCD